MNSTLIADLIAAGVQFRPEEAVAIAQQLIHTTATIVSTPAIVPLGPPSPGNVRLHADGSVTCDGYHVKPAVFEMAILVQTLLPPGSMQVPGALRYAIARGLLEVDAPPFDSIEEFSRVLERFERGHRREVVRRARARSTEERLPFVRPYSVAASGDRRRTSPPPTVLRRELREADRLLYERRPVTIMFPTPTPTAKRTPLRLPAAILAGGAILAGVADRLYVRAPDPGSSARPAVASASAASAAHLVQPETTVGRDRLRPHQPGRSNQAVVQATPPAQPRVQSELPVVARRNVATEGQLVPALDPQRRPVFSPAFASNGAAMFFHIGGTHDAPSALAMAPVSPIDGGDLRVVTIVDDGARNYHVQPSPDGQFIAFDSDRDGDRGVYLANSDGTHVRRISGPGYAAVPTWAPDGRRVAYIRAEPDRPRVWNLWLQSVGGTDAKRLTSYRWGQLWNASWFPDDRRICYTHEDKVIVLDLETAHTREFSSPVEGRLVRTPAVSPDGTKVIFQVFRNGAWILDLEDGSMRCVLTDPTAEEFAWAPDGRRVAFHSRRNGQWGIYILHRS